MYVPHKLYTSRKIPLISTHNEPDKMISLPFGTGTVAAFFFLFSELFLFPILTYSTAILAVLFLNRQASRKGEIIDTKPIQFPLWNEGLLSYQKSHIFLLALRALLIIIPVYLESQLESKRTPNSLNLPHAYTPQPLKNFSFPNLKPKIDGSIPRDILEISAVIFNRCSRIDEFGWRVASIANVSVLENGKTKIKCVPRTERRVFRQMSNMDADDMESKMAESRTLDLKLSWNLGWLEAFNGTSSTEYPFPFIQYVKLEVAQNMTCATNDLELVDVEHEEAVETVETKLKDITLCQDAREDFISFYRIASCEHVNISKYEHKQVISVMNRSMDEKEIVSVHIHRVRCATHLLERLQLHNENFLAAQNFVYVRNIMSFQDNENTKYRHMFNDLTARSLYTRRENYRIEVEGEAFGVTEISDEIITVGITEIFIILLFSMLMWCIASCTNQVFQKPNTLNGLSEIWAFSRAVQENSASEKFSKRVCLRLEESKSGPNEYTWVPTADLINKI